MTRCCVTQVAWLRGDTSQVMTVGTLAFTPDVRILVLHPVASSRWNLLIRSVTPADAGPYLCEEFLHGGGSHVTAVELVVVE